VRIAPGAVVPDGSVVLGGSQVGGERDGDDSLRPLFERRGLGMGALAGDGVDEADEAPPRESVREWVRRLLARRSES
jgi:hypothetical protein